MDYYQRTRFNDFLLNESYFLILLKSVNKFLFKQILYFKLIYWLNKKDFFMEYLIKFNLVIHQP